MEKHRVYCSALDREVHVFLRPVECDEVDPGHALMPAVVCLEHAEDCLGQRCPLCDVAADGWLHLHEWLFNRGHMP
jgi:hypothetical protein